MCCQLDQKSWLVRRTPSLSTTSVKRTSKSLKICYRSTWVFLWSIIWETKSILLKNNNRIRKRRMTMSRLTRLLDHPTFISILKWATSLKKCKKITRNLERALSNYMMLFILMTQSFWMCDSSLLALTQIRRMWSMS